MKVYLLKAKLPEVDENHAFVVVAISEISAGCLAADAAADETAECLA
jgi:hypothetical protein